MQNTSIFFYDWSVGRPMAGSLLVSRRQPVVPCASEQMEAGRDFIDACCVADRMGGGARAGDWEGADGPQTPIATCCLRNVQRSRSAVVRHTGCSPKIRLRTVVYRPSRCIFMRYGSKNTPCSGRLPSHKVRKLATGESFGQSSSASFGTN